MESRIGVGWLVESRRLLLLFYRGPRIITPSRPFLNVEIWRFCPDWPGIYLAIFKNLSGLRNSIFFGTALEAKKNPGQAVMKSGFMVGK